MKKVFLSLIFVLSFSLFAGENPYLLFREIDQELASLKLAQESKKDIFVAYENYEKVRGLQNRLRAYSDNLNQDLLKRISEDKPILGQDLTIIHKSVKYFLLLSSRMLSLSRDFTPYELSELDDVLVTQELEESRENIFWFMVQTTVLEDYLLGYRKWMTNQKIRRIVNAEDSSYKIKKNQLKKYIYSLLNRKHQKLLRKASVGFDRTPTWRGRHGQRDQLFLKISNKIRKFEAKKFLTSKKNLKSLKKELRKSYRSDGVKNFFDFTVHHISGFIGNLAGSIKWRKGWLYKRDEINQEIYSHLRPLDMITEKTPFILTDTLIPGHFGHNAIWLGTKEQLIAYGLWNHPSIKPLQHMIEKGYSIIESDRKDTHLKRLEDFMKVDEFAIMRNKKIFKRGKNYVDRVYQVSLAQLGKTYDFNFDVETTDQLVCSELLYQSFGHIAWPTEKYLGRTTISPDNVGELLLYGKSPNELVYYIAAYEKNDLVRKDIEDMGKDMGYRLNKERSRPSYPYFEKPEKKCRKMISNKGSWKSCSTKWKHRVYSAPVERDFPDLGD